MNKRIKVLIEQATTRIDPIAHDGACWDFDREKFAELIVRQCMTLCEDVTERNDPAIACYYEIKQYFLEENYDF